MASSPDKKSTPKKFPTLKNADLCTHCGYCLPQCPTFQVENNEGLSPRGRLSIILGMKAGRIDPQQAVDAISSCIACRACHSACPAGVRTGKMVLMTRRLGESAHPPGITLLHKITDSHQLSAWFSRLISFYKHSGLQRFVRFSRILNLIPSLKRIEGLIPPIRAELYDLPHTLPSSMTRKQTKGRVALLGGCMAKLFLPHVGLYAREMIEALGYETVVLANYGCCGAPYREQGEMKPFKRQAKKLLQAFSKAGRVDHVICDASVCAITTRSYGKAMGREEGFAELAKEFSGKIEDLSIFLSRHVEEGSPLVGDPGMGTLAFHDHCQTHHGLGTIEEPRRLLDALPVPRREIEGAGQCCGAGGDYMLRFPERSLAIRQSKLEAIRASGADTVVAGNPGCLMSLQAGLREQNSAIKVRHVAELFWAASHDRVAEEDDAQG
ncbi:(Fe-S)-binding protein [Magnetococcales bacterium HHB-1]